MITTPTVEDRVVLGVSKFFRDTPQGVISVIATQQEGNIQITYLSGQVSDLTEKVSADGTKKVQTILEKVLDELIVALATKKQHYTYADITTVDSSAYSRLYSNNQRRHFRQ